MTDFDGFGIEGNSGVFDEAAELLAGGDAVGFVGAGASAGLYPLWGGLLWHLVQAARDLGLDEDGAKTLLDEADRDPQFAVTQIRHVFGDEGVYRRRLAEIFEPKRGADGLGFTATHRRLMHLPLKAFVTTNYDSGLHEARRHVWPDLSVQGFATPKNKTVLQGWLTGEIHKKDRPILSLHGAEDDPSSMVLHVEDYRESYLRDGLFQRVFSRLWCQERLFLVGYSFADEWNRFSLDREITASLKRETEGFRHVAVVDRDAEWLQSSSRVRLERAKFLNQYRARVLFYPVRDGDHSALGELLDRLAGAGAPAQGTVSSEVSSTDRSSTDRSSTDGASDTVPSGSLQVPSGPVPSGPVPSGTLRVAPPAMDEVRDYLEDQRERVRYLDLQGLAPDESAEALNPMLDRLYTPLYGRDPVRSDTVFADGDPEGRKRLESLIGRSGKVLIEGPAGCGKSTFLRWTVSVLGRRFLGEPIPKDCDGLAELDVEIPVFLSLEGLAREVEADRPADRDRLLDLLARDCSRKGLRFERDTWQRLVDDGRVGFFLDGLDEVADGEARRHVLAILEDAAEAWPVRWVVASRPFLTEALRRHGFTRLEIEALDLEDIRCFLAKWVAMLYDERARVAQRGAAEAYQPKLEKAMERGDLRRLASNPMMLTCLCVAHWARGELPRGRARIYEAVLRWLLDAKRETRLSRFGLQDSEALEALSELALDAMGPGAADRRSKRAVLELDEDAELVRPLFDRAHPELDETARRRHAREWLSFEAAESGILEDLPGDRLRFWHLTFQEYLAAVRLAKTQVGEDWWPILEPRLDDAQWRETVELFASCLKLHNGVSHADRFVSLVLDLGSDGDDLAQDAKVAAILGRILPALEAYGYRAEPVKVAAHRALRTRVLQIFEPAGADTVPVHLRLAAAEALGRGGDPRLAVERFEERLLEVPGTEIRLGRYPVTVEEW